MNVRAYPVVACCLALLIACRSESERQETRDAARVSHRVNELRDAPNNAKQGPLATLKKEPCTQPKVCELQTVCVQAYELHVKSVALSAKVRQSMRDGEDTVTAEALRLLEVAEKNLGHARELIKKCTDLQGELERTFR